MHYTLCRMLPIQSGNLQEVLIQDGCPVGYGMFLLYSAEGAKAGVYIYRVYRGKPQLRSLCN